MSRKIFISGSSYEIDDSDQIGVGGEAAVYRIRGFAQPAVAKIFHSTIGPKEILEKHDRTLAFPKALSKLANVVGPLAPVLDGKDRFIGYAMPEVSGGSPIHLLSVRAFRDQYDVEQAQVAQILTALATVVEHVHKAKVVIGDFNDGNVLVRDAKPFLIDLDSAQYDRFRCSVAHEKFLAPWLYGKAIANGLDEASDWYAFATIALQSLLLVHPYGGVHKSYPTALRRAEAHVSIFNPDVRLPKGAFPIGILADTVAHLFTQVFERGERRSPFPIGPIANTSWHKLIWFKMHTHRFTSEQVSARLTGKLEAVDHLRARAEVQSGEAFARRDDKEAQKLRDIANWLKAQEDGFRAACAQQYAVTDATPDVLDALTGARVEW